MKYDGEMKRKRESFYILELIVIGICFFRRWLIFCRVFFVVFWLIFFSKMRFLVVFLDVSFFDCRDF